jgi:hypothetical protein
VWAAADWQTTDTIINKEDRVIIEYMHGLWTITRDSSPLHDAQGLVGPNKYICSETIHASNCKEIAPDYPSGALLGRIGSNLIRIGNRAEFVSGFSGPLLLRINDTTDGLYDNDGSVVVRIIVWSRP